MRGNKAALILKRHVDQRRIVVDAAVARLSEEDPDLDVAEVST
jgi:hypothetical protein